MEKQRRKAQPDSDPTAGEGCANTTKQEIVTVEDYFEESDEARAVRLGRQEVWQAQAATTTKKRKKRKVRQPLLPYTPLRNPEEEK